MCGIIGTVGPWSMNDKDRQIVRNMFYLDVLRGRDSSGAVFFSALDNKRHWFKAVGLPDAVEEIKGYKEAWNAAISAFIGHNRFATMGEVNVNNAHPFEKGAVVGVHNGTLYKEDIVRLLAFIDRETPEGVTDTEIIYEVLASNPVQTLWENISGPATLVWVNTEEGSVNIAIHDKRPLFSWEAPNGRLFFASEPWMLSVGITRVHPNYDVRPKKIEKDIHFCITRENESYGINQTRLTQKTVRTPLVPFVDRYSKKYTNYSDLERGEHDHRGHNFHKKETIAEQKKKGTPPKPKIMLSLNVTPNSENLKKRADGTFISKDRLSESQCSWCSKLLIIDKCELYAEDLQLCDECDAVAHHTENT